MDNTHSPYTFRISFGKMVTERIQAHLAKTGDGLSDYIIILVIRDLMRTGTLSQDDLIKSFAGRQDRRKNIPNNE